MPSIDWIPSRENDFYDFCKTWDAILRKSDNITAYKWEVEDAGEVVLRIKKFIDARDAYKANNSTANRKAKDAAAKTAETVIRDFANASVRFNKFIPADVKLAMGIRQKDPVRSPVSARNTRALITELRPLGGFQVEVRFQDESTPGSKAVPYGCNGCLLYYAFSDERITDYTKLSLSKLMTRTPWTLALPPDAERKFLSCATRWQNDRGELGPWSEISHVVVA